MKNLLLFLFLLPALTAAQQTGHERDTRVLLELTRTGELALQSVDQMMALFQQSYPAPEDFWKEFRKEIVPSEFVDLIVPIYMKYYTHDEIKGLIAFYKTPLGQRTIEVLPQITAESMQVGQEWGAMLGERVQKRLKEKGHD